MPGKPGYPHLPTPHFPLDSFGSLPHLLPSPHLPEPHLPEPHRMLLFALPYSACSFFSPLHFVLSVCELPHFSPIPAKSAVAPMPVNSAAPSSSVANLVIFILNSRNHKSFTADSAKGPDAVCDNHDTGAITFHKQK